MSKAHSAPKPRSPLAPKSPPSAPPAPRPTATDALPLKDATITFMVPGEDGEYSVRGEDVAKILQYVATACPNVPRFLSPDRTAFPLKGLSEVCDAFGEADPEGAAPNYREIFGGLGYILSDLAARLATTGELAENDARAAKLTITRIPETAQTAPIPRSTGAW